MVTPGNCFVDSKVYLIIFSSMAVKGSSSPPLGVILTPNENKEHIHFTQVAKSASISSVAQTSNAYLHLTQAAKSASISSTAQTDNVSVCLSHSSGPWILDSRAYDHLSGNKDLFSSLTITSPLPMITLANGSQTMDK